MDSEIFDFVRRMFHCVSSMNPDVVDPTRESNVFSGKSACGGEYDQLSTKLAFYDRHLSECLKICKKRVVQKYAMEFQKMQEERERKGLSRLPTPGKGSLMSLEKSGRFSPSKYMQQKQQKLQTQMSKRMTQRAELQKNPPAPVPQPTIQVSDSLLGKTKKETPRHAIPKKPTNDYLTPSFAEYTSHQSGDYFTLAAQAAASYERRRTVADPYRPELTPPLIGSDQYFANLISTYGTGNDLSDPFALSNIPRVDPVTSEEAARLHNPTLHNLHTSPTGNDDTDKDDHINCNYSNDETAPPPALVRPATAPHSTSLPRRLVTPQPERLSESSEPPHQSQSLGSTQEPSPLVDTSSSCYPADSTPQEGLNGSALAYTQSAHLKSAVRSANEPTPPRATDTDESTAPEASSAQAPFPLPPTRPQTATSAVRPGSLRSRALRAPSSPQRPSTATPTDTSTSMVGIPRRGSEPVASGVSSAGRSPLATPAGAGTNVRKFPPPASYLPSPRSTRVRSQVGGANDSTSPNSRPQSRSQSRSQSATASRPRSRTITVNHPPPLPEELLSPVVYPRRGQEKQFIETLSKIYANSSKNERVRRTVEQERRRVRKENEVVMQEIEVVRTLQTVEDVSELSPRDTLHRPLSALKITPLPCPPEGFLPPSPRARMRGEPPLYVPPGMVGASSPHRGASRSTTPKREVVETLRFTFPVSTYENEDTRVEDERVVEGDGKSIDMPPQGTETPEQETPEEQQSDQPTPVESGPEGSANEDADSPRYTPDSAATPSIEVPPSAPEAPNAERQLSDVFSSPTVVISPGESTVPPPPLKIDNLQRPMSANSSIMRPPSALSGTRRSFLSGENRNVHFDVQKQEAMLLDEAAVFSEGGSDGEEYPGDYEDAN